MRRALVLGDETANHPFLQTLPRHVRGAEAKHPLRQPEKPSRTAKALTMLAHWRRESLSATARWTHAALCAIRRARSKKMSLTTGDAKDFLLAYCACFLAVSAFIA